MNEARDSSRISIIKSIKGWINEGKLPPGSPMPTERELSKQLATQRLTIRGALAALEHEGVVQRIGLRTRVVANRTHIMDHSMVIINTTKHQWFTDRMHMPGWAIMVPVGALAEVSHAGYNLLLIPSERISDYELQRLLNGRPNGVIFPDLLGDFPNKNVWLEKLHAAGIPVVVYGSAPELAPYDRVCSDHEIGSYKLTQHMLSLGAKRPLMFYGAPSSLLWVQERRKGYERAMQEAGLEPLPLKLFPPCPEFAASGTAEQFDAGRRFFSSYLMDYLGPLATQPKVDALLLVTDGHLYPASAACRTLGFKPGSDILLAGYDNYWVESWERFYEPVFPSATVDKQNTEAGREMVRLVCDRAAGKLPAAPQVRRIEPQLVISKKNNPIG